MKHNIHHREVHNGLVYTIVDESRLAETTDFFYNYFLTGKMPLLKLQLLILSLS